MKLPTLEELQEELETLQRLRGDGPGETMLDLPIAQKALTIVLQEAAPLISYCLYKNKAAENYVTIRFGDDDKTHDFQVILHKRGKDLPSKDW